MERARGITVKAQTASMIWTHPDTNEEYLLNLIDTPGHVDFSYEVARSLAACQGALLLVDCSQGVQAQTVANYHAAKEAGLTIVRVQRRAAARGRGGVVQGYGGGVRSCGAAGLC